MSGDFIDSVGKDQPTEPYLNFSYKKTFPGYSQILPAHFAISNVISQDLDFLPIIKQYHTVTTPESLDRWIFDMGQKLKFTNAFKSYLISLHDVSEQEVSVNIQTQAKSYIPLFHELFKLNKGFYPHVQFNNKLANGERIQVGYAVNQLNSQWLWKTSVPVEEECKLKTKLMQKFTEHSLPVKTGSVKLKEYRQLNSKSKQCWAYRAYVKNGDYSSKILQKRIFGLSSEYKFTYSNNKKEALVLDSVEKMGVQLELYPSSLSYGYRMYYSTNPTVNLMNVLNHDLILTSNLILGYSKNITNRSPEIYGYKRVEQSDGFQVKNIAVLFFRTHRLLNQLSLIPSVQVSTMFKPQTQSAYLGDKFKFSLATGLVVPFGSRKSLFVQYNWLHFHSHNDYPLKVQLEFL